MDTRVPVVELEDASRRFVVRKSNNLKERLVNFGRDRQFSEDFWALRNVSTEIFAGETIGLIGPNGSGKSTLLKAVGGIIRPSSGQVRTRGRVAALLELGAGFHQDLTGRENVYLNASILGMSRKQTNAVFDDVVEFAEVGGFIDTQVKFYSSGMYVRLAFAVAVHADPDIFLIDEVLAVGDEEFQKKCFDKVRSFQQEGRTIVIVSHTLSQITEFCSRALVLGRGSIVFDGDPVDAVSVLRSGFRGHGTQDTVDDSFAHGPRVRIAEVSVTDRAGVERHEFDSDEEIVVTVDVLSQDPLQEWSVGLHVDNPLGQLVVGTDTRANGLILPELDETPTRTAFSIPGNRLGTGEYGVTVNVSSKNGQELGRHSHAASFRVNGSTRIWGPVNAEIVISVD